MEKKKQIMRYSDEEMQVIKVFSENDELAKAIRKLMLQMPLSALDLSVLQVCKSKELMAVVKKTFLPTLDGNAPIHQVVDLWITLKIDDKHPDYAIHHIKSREILINYLDQQLKFLEDIENIEKNYKKGGKIQLSEMVNFKDKSPVDAYVELFARNTLVSHVEQMLNQLLVLAGKKEETVEETQERLAKNSAK